MTEKHARPPAGLKAPGRSLWRSVVADYDLDEHEMATLLEACRTRDALADLQSVIDRDGVMDATGKRPHPALVELRLQRVTLARLIVALRIPAEGATGGGRTQRRGGVRGVYPIRSEVVL